ncbi:MAG: hypothetical protein GF393_01615 [Armatimonadia bacterium]|nr:hypothetical protein [Armatimonadia bacterium]
MESPRPFPFGVLYADPNPDGSRKSCTNCALWDGDARQTCMIFDLNVVVTGEMVCGYHVFGARRHPGPDLDAHRVSMDPVVPEQAGLETVPGGTSCDVCHFYDAGTGRCHLVADPEDPKRDALVDPLGCCAAWRRALGYPAK